MKRKIAILIATWFGSGFIKPASGTWGSLAGYPFALALTYYTGGAGIIFGSVIVFIIGLWAAKEYEIYSGEHDSSRIVVDEVCGIIIASTPLLMLFEWWVILASFVLFRLFDAWKTGVVGWCDRYIDGAFGVMIDDVVAGLLTAIVLMFGLLWI